MKTETKVLGGILLLTVALLTGAVIFLSKNSSKPVVDDNTKVVSIDYSKGQKIGSDSAKVRLVEFSDLQCPACKAAEPMVKQVLSKYPANLQFIYRHFPLPQHRNGKAAATLAEAAGQQGKFWQMHDLLFETQDSWANLTDPTDYFLDLAGKLDLDKNKVKEALSKRIYDTIIGGDVAEGENLGVNSTPTFFVNGRKVNLFKFDDLDAAVVGEMNK